jgi:hypothetical protein
LAVSRDSEAQTAAADWSTQWVAQDGMFVSAEDLQPSTIYESVTTPGQDEADFEPTPSPGSLYIGDGCGAEELPAIEREWHVLIDNGIATVQVMQTFVLPEQTERMVLSPSEASLGDEVRDAESGAPSFSALLPTGAEFLDIKLDVTNGRLHGKASALNEDDEQDYQSVMRTMREAQARGELLIYLNQAGSAPYFSSAQVLDLRAGETIVVTYRYRIAIEQDNGCSQLMLPLQALPEDADEAAAPIDISTHSASGTVWVEWKNPKTAPRVFDAMPIGTTVEQNRGGIAGLNWATDRIVPGEKFVLGWR